MKAELDLPAGFRFHPTDDELVKYYLCRKCASDPIAVPVIAEIDLYKFDPWDLPEMASYGEKEWYFFSPRDRKYPNGSRPNRSAGTGYWKATGADKPIGKPKALGIKKALVFYAGKAPRGIKTNWIMHEYRLANVDRSASINRKDNSRLDEWVLCRIYNKKGTMEKFYPTEEKPTTARKQLHSRSPNYESHSYTSHSFPSSSSHVLSPDVTCDNREVQSKLDEALGAFDNSPFDFNSMDWLQNDAFAPQFQYQLDLDLLSTFQEDALMYTEQKPFCN